MSEEQDINPSELTYGPPDEERCRAFLEGLRWPAGVRCPRCGSDKISRIMTRGQLDCDPCRYRFSVTAGTTFHDTHLPLWKWFVAIDLIVESEGGVSASQIKRTIAVSYKTAWHLRRRILDALAESDARLLLSMIEEAETSGGGEKEGKECGYQDTDAAADNAADSEDRLTSEWPGQWKIRNSGTKGEMGKKRDKGRDADAEGNANSAFTVRSLLASGSEGFYQVSEEHLNVLLNALTLHFERQENPLTFRDAVGELLKAGTLP